MTKLYIATSSFNSSSLMSGISAERAVDGILKQIDEDGTVLNVSAGTAMGMNAEHYKNIAIAPMAYGQSLTILALVEALQLS